MANQIEQRLKVYSLRTPKYRNQIDIEKNGKKFDKKHFEYSTVKAFFNVMKNSNLSNLFLEVSINDTSETCRLTFKDFEDNNPDFAIIKFFTNVYGTNKDITDMNNYQIVGNLESHHSIPYEVNMFLHKRHGILFVSKDINNVINKYSLNRFINHYRIALDNYIKQWNEENEYVKMYKMPVIKVDSLPSMQFFEELDLLRSIKEFSFVFDPTGSQDYADYADNDIMNENGFRRNQFKEKRIFKDLFNRIQIENVKHLYEDLYHKSNYDDFKVIGTNFNGKEVTVKPNFPTRTLLLYLMPSQVDNNDIIIQKIQNELNVSNNLLGRVFARDNANDIVYDDTKELDNIVSELEEQLRKATIDIEAEN